MGQTTRTVTPSPWRKPHEAVRILKLRCERGGDGMRRFKAYCITDNGGILKEANVSAIDIEANCAGWHDFKAMPTDQWFEFPEDDLPKAIINYKAGDNHTITDIQPDYEHYAAVYRDMLVEAGVYAKCNSREAQRTIGHMPTLVDAIVWTKKLIEDNKKPEKSGKEILNEHFGEKPTEPHWIDDSDSRERSKFWGDVHACGNQYEAWTELSTQDTDNFVHGVVGSKIHDSKLTRPEMTKLVIDAINAKYSDKEQAVTEQATIESPTKEQWMAWLSEQQLNNDAGIEYVIGLLNSNSIERNAGPVRKFSEWDQDIPAAMALVEKDRAAKAEKAKADQKSTESHQTAPTTNGSKPTPSTLPKMQNKPVGNRFKKAEQKNSKLRMCIGGVSGGGKTFTSLEIARTMFPDGKIALIDTESGSAEKFAKIFNFDVMELSDYQPEAYIEAIHEAEALGYDVLIIDSLTHEWQGNGGLLDMVEDLKAKLKTSDGKPDTRAAWREMSPRHQALIDAILKSKMHIIATVRAKVKEVVERTEDRKATTKKMILDFIQRDGIEYEFDIVLRIDSEHRVTTDKSRCTELDGYKGIKCGVEVGSKVARWLNIEQAAPEMATAS